MFFQKNMQNLLIFAHFFRNRKSLQKKQLKENPFFETAASKQKKRNDFADAFGILQFD